MNTINRRGFIRGMLGLAAMAAFPFTWTAKKATKVFTGARAKVYINGQLIGTFDQTSWSINDKTTGEPYDLKPLNVLGRYEPIEMKVRVTKVDHEAINRLMGDTNGRTDT